MNNLEGKKAVVLGLGVSGMGAARFLREKGAEVTVRDNATSAIVKERAETLRRHGIRVELGDAISTAESFDFGVISPGISPEVPLVRALRAQNIPLIGELEMASRYCACPIVAITGTNGKTTTTELIDALLRVGGKRTMASGNIGTAFSAAVRESVNLDLMVLEVSSFQLEHIADFHPRISVHLNLTPDHLDRYHSMEEYERAKWQIFRNQTADDYAIVNVSVRLPRLAAHKITFSTNGQLADYQLLDGWLVAYGERVLEQSRTRLIGAHNAENMLAALAVADLYSVPRAAAIAALIAYRPLPHRCEHVGEIDGITFLNDSKATNIDALAKALIAMPQPVVLLAGGKDKGLDFRPLLPLIRRHVKAAVLIGQMADKLFEAWSATVPCQRASSLGDAFEQTLLLAEPGETVLFSPGCSSYDMFRDFEDRGNQFRALVQARSGRAKPFSNQTPPQK
jgi:UDP-N-acetylmuramoylalanine--D-glutamate ligase